MTTDNKLTTSQPRVANKPAAITSFMAAACFFLLAAREQDLAPAFVVIGGLSMLGGSLFLLGTRKAATQLTTEAGDRQAEAGREEGLG